MNTGVIKLSHFSVKEYLISTHVEEYFSIDEKTSHSMISKLSITYLLQFDDDSAPLTEAMLESMPLAKYAAEHWIVHAKSGEIDPNGLQLILHLFTSGSAPLTNSIRIFNIDGQRWSRLGIDDLSMNKAEVCSALYYSSLAGIKEVSDCLLQKGENANAKGGCFGNALQAASYSSNEAIVKLLLVNGAEVNADGGQFGNALQAASYSHSDNEAIVKLLLENGAEVNAEGGYYGNALQAASYSGNEAIVKLLLENGAEVNAERGYYGNALQAASYSGNEAISEGHG